MTDVRRERRDRERWQQDVDRVGAVADVIGVAVVILGIVALMVLFSPNEPTCLHSHNELVHGVVVNVCDAERPAPPRNLRIVEVKP